MRSQRMFLEEAGLDHNTFRQLTGYTTRNRNVQKTQPTNVTERTEDRRKNIIKKEIYTAPVIPEAPNAIKIQFPKFKDLVEELYQSRDDSPKGIMNIELLYEVYTQAVLNGGIVEVSSIGGFDSLMRNVLILANPEHIYQELTPQLIQKIRQLLFSVQFLNRNQNLPRKIYELGLVNFVSKDQLSQQRYQKNWGLKYFNYDLTLFQQGAEGLNVDKSIFNLDYMCKHYGKQKIDIRIQNPLDYGFKPSKLKNKRYEMTLGEYRFYQQNFMDASVMKNFKHTEQLGKGQVFFGVNFQPSDQMLNRQIKKSVSGTFLDFHGDFDMMSYIDTDVPGCSLPQMYFKTPGCWTGGHQQNVSMSALNINHGPQHSEWFTLDLKYVKGLRKQLIQKFQIDLYSSQGLWYEKLDWFIERGYPVKRFLQRKDDIVVTGPGTLHWVRSFGVAIQTSWNIFPKTYEQFEAAFNRHAINKQIKFHKSDTIPLKSLIMKYLNHERKLMPNNIRQLCVRQLQKWYNQQQQIVTRLTGKISKRIYFYLKDLESFCSICKQEVLVYFFPAPAHKERGISCLQCFEKQNLTCSSIFDQLYYKLDAFLVKRLIEISKDDQLNTIFEDQIQDLCQGVYVGELPVKCKMSKKVQDRMLIKQQFTNASQEQIITAQKQIFYNNEEKFLLYKNILKVTFEIQDKIKSKSKQKIKPNINTSCGKMTMIDTLQEGEMQPQIQSQQIKNVDAQCQTQGKYKKVEQKESGQYSSQSAQKKKKKKKKEKSKKKKEKQAKKEQQDSPKFKTSDQQCKARASQPRSPQQNQSDRYQRQNDSSNRQNSRNWRVSNDKYQNNSYRGNNESNQGFDRQNNRNWRDNIGFRDNRQDGNNRNTNYNDRGQNNYGKRGNWNDRNNNQQRDQDQNQNQKRVRSHQNEQGQADGQSGGRRYGQDGFRERNFEARGRGRGGGDRGRGRGGRGGFSRDNNYQDRNINQQGDNNRSQNNVKTSQKYEEPDEY